MIGFVESMEFDVIISEVNTNITSCGLSIPPLSVSTEGWQQDGVSCLEHQLIRTFPISPFQLLHFWLDIRNCDMHPTAPKTVRKSVERMSKSTSGDRLLEKAGKIPNRETLKKQVRKVLSNENDQLELPMDHL